MRGGYDTGKVPGERSPCRRHRISRMTRSREDALVGAVEAGGSKVVCAVGTGPGERMLARASFPTGDDPARLFAAAFGWLQEQERRLGRLQALGIASFGPVDLDTKSPTYGWITSTPK